MKIHEKIGFALFLIVTSFISQELNAQDYEWGAVFGGTANQISTSIDVDASRNVYSTGRWRNGTVDFDPGPGTSNLTAGAEWDGYVQKLDANGNFLWVRQIGGTLSVTPLELKVDASGNVIIVGYFEGTVDFNPGAGTNNRTSVGNLDIFILKLDASGNFLWVRTFGSVDEDMAQGVDLDSSGDILIGGKFRQTIDFDPGPGVSNTTSAGNSELFVLRLDTNGNFVWVKSYGGIDNENLRAITVDGNGNIYTVGHIQGTADLDPGPGVFNITAIFLASHFVQKLDASGNFVWGRVVTDGVFNVINDVAVDIAGNVYTSGEFQNTTDLDPSAATANFTASGTRDGFVQKLDAAGNYVTAFIISSAGFDETGPLSTDALGNVYLTGAINATFDFDPGPGTAIINPTSQTGFVQKINATGDFVWVIALEATNNTEYESIALDDETSIYLLGNFGGTVDLDPGVSVDNYSVSGSGFGYSFQKLRQCETSGTDIVSACGSYTWIDGNIYTTSNNTATFTLTNAAGCDSLVTLDLTINSSTSGTDAVTACDSYTWIDGNTYTTSNNTATFTLTNAAGCDSLVTLDLTINNSTSGTDVITACDSYTWIDGNTYTASNNTATVTLTNAIGCDSVVTLDLTINNSTVGTDVIAACNSYTWIDGNTYTASNNTATFTLTNTVGCDSLVTLDLTINSSNSGIDVVTACDSYTWVDGNTYTASNNTATFTLTNASGCDSLVTLNLTLNNSTSGTDVITACDSYTWIDGNTYTASNNAATYTLTNAVGCDSIVTLDLTINNTTTGTDLVTACDSYTWIDGNTYTASNNTATFMLTNALGCDSLVTLDLTINNTTTGVDVINSCYDYTWIDGNTYTASNNTATYTLTNAAGCDSLITLDLTIEDVIAPTASNPDTAWVECIADAIIDVTVVDDAMDNCIPQPIVTYVSDVITGNGCQDTITRTYNVADDYGNNIDVVQIIIVEDVTPPTASNPFTVNIQCASDMPAPAVGWVSDEADNCTAQPLVTWVSDVSDGLTCPETITRTFSVSDDCGNSITVAQLIVINDIVAPVADIASLPTETSYCNVSLTPPTATDNCDGTVIGTTTTSFPINSVGTTNVVWEFADACGNTSTQTQVVIIEQMEVGVTIANDAITLISDNAEIGVTYQWLDCISDEVVLGATNKNFTPTYGSDFAVITAIGSCSDTSACFNSTVGLEEVSAPSVVVYPNPVNGGMIHIETTAAIVNVTLMDMTGRTIPLHENETFQSINVSHVKTGNYLMYIETAEGRVIKDISVVR